MILATAGHTHIFTETDGEVFSNHGALLYAMHKLYRVSPTILLPNSEEESL
jgi:hypothetical protein